MFSRLVIRFLVECSDELRCCIRLWILLGSVFWWVRVVENSCVVFSGCIRLWLMVVRKWVFDWLVVLVLFFVLLSFWFNCESFWVCFWICCFSDLLVFLRFCLVLW